MVLDEIKRSLEKKREPQEEDSRNDLIQDVFSECAQDEKKVLSLHKKSHGLIPFGTETEEMVSVHVDLIFSGDEDFRGELVDPIRESLMNKYSDKGPEVKMIVDMALAAYVNWIRMQRRIQEINNFSRINMEEFEILERLIKMADNFSKEYLRYLETLNVMTRQLPEVNIKRAERVNIAKNLQYQENVRE